MCSSEAVGVFGAEHSPPISTWYKTIKRSMKNINKECGNREMASNQGKTIFIGGISWETSEETLRKYFENYGEVFQAVIVYDQNTRRPRGFGFVVFANPFVLDRVLQDKHTIDGRKVDVRRSLSREEQLISSRSGNLNAGGNIETKSIFVGGLPPTLTEEGLRQYFEVYGQVTDVGIRYNPSTQQSRGFGFITFDSEDAVDKVLHKIFHNLNGHFVEVKHALQKNRNPGGGGSLMGGGNYQGYGGSSANTSTYEGQMDSNWYMQPQITGVGFPAYGSPGYLAPGYGYGLTISGVGYGVGAYGIASAGYDGPAWAYGNSNAPNASFVSGSPGEQRSLWGNQREMASNQGKTIFIGGISWETSEETLRKYFENYGEVFQAVIVYDQNTRRPRGFGFVVFADPFVLDRVLQDKHTIDGRKVDVRRSLSREEQLISSRSGNLDAGGNIETKSIFVGGLPPTLTEKGLRQYFEVYGQVTDVGIRYNPSTQQSRGFGFITFDSEDAVDKVLHKIFHNLNGHFVEVKHALQKNRNPGGGGSLMGGGNYRGYGGSSANTSTYEGQMDSNWYMQPQITGVGFPAYGSPGYAAPGYGYGLTISGVGYGIGAYGIASAGYDGPAWAYGNSNAPNAGFVIGSPGEQRSLWGTQVPSGDGSGNAGYGNAAYWTAPGVGSASGIGGSVSATRGQFPIGVSCYGNQGYGYVYYGGSGDGDSCYRNQGYGYVGYGGSGGYYINLGGYGFVGGRADSASNGNAGAGGVEQQGTGSV